MVLNFECYLHYSSAHEEKRFNRKFVDTDRAENSDKMKPVLKLLATKSKCKVTL